MPEAKEDSKGLKKNQGKIQKRMESVHRVYGKHCSWHFSSSSLLQTCFIVIDTYLLYFKTPKQVFFNPNKYIFDIFFTRPGLRSGNIPSSFSLPFTELLQTEAINGIEVTCFKSKKELREVISMNQSFGAAGKLKNVFQVWETSIVIIVKIFFY